METTGKWAARPGPAERGSLSDPGKDLRALRRIQVPRPLPVAPHQEWAQLAVDGDKGAPLPIDVPAYDPPDPEGRRGASSSSSPSSSRSRSRSPSPPAARKSTHLPICSCWKEATPNHLERSLFLDDQACCLSWDSIRG